MCNFQIENFKNDKKDEAYRNLVFTSILKSSSRIIAFSYLTMALQRKAVISSKNLFKRFGLSDL